MSFLSDIVARAVDSTPPLNKIILTGYLLGTNKKRRKRRFKYYWRMVELPPPSPPPVVHGITWIVLSVC